MRLTATSLDNRIEALDIMRGFALLGIFIANMLMFHSPYWYIEPYTFFSSGSDPATFQWIDIFVQSSFYPIFAFLFGYGLNMQYQKAIERNKPYASFMAKRLTILLLFGLLHALLIWTGDVLFTYAVLGYLLILFLRIPARWLLPFATVLYVGPISLMYLLTKWVIKISPEAITEELGNNAKIEAVFSMYAQGSFGEIFIFRLLEWLTYGLSSTATGFFVVLPIIMLGAAMSKWKIIERAVHIKKPLIIVAILFVIAGIGIKSILYLKEPTYDLVLIQDSFGGLILAVGYMAVLLLLCTIPLFRAVFRPIGKVGRMSLTTYLTQSLVATTLFYGYGFGLYGQIDLLTGTFIAVAVFIIQVIFANLWLSKFGIGPLEWIWRILTYGKSLTK